MSIRLVLRRLNHVGLNASNHGHYAPWLAVVDGTLETAFAAGFSKLFVSGSDIIVDRMKGTVGLGSLLRRIHTRLDARFVRKMVVLVMLILLVRSVSKSPAKSFFDGATGSKLVNSTREPT